MPPISRGWTCSREVFRAPHSASQASNLDREMIAICSLVPWPWQRPSDPERYSSKMFQALHLRSFPNIAAISCKSFPRLGYQPEWKVLQAADYGVPQLRPRFVLVAFRPATPSISAGLSAAQSVPRWAKRSLI